MDITLLDGRVLARRLDPETRTPGGVLIPNVAQKKSREARVVAVSALGHMMQCGTRRPQPVQAGDTVLIGQHAGIEVRYGGEDLVLLTHDEVFAILERPK